METENSTSEKQSITQYDVMQAEINNLIAENTELKETIFALTKFLSVLKTELNNVEFSAELDL